MPAAEFESEKAVPRAAAHQQSLLSQKKFYVLVGVLAAYVVARGVVAAAIKPFWFDELFTLTVASQPTARDILRALQKAVDSQPLLFYLLEKWGMALVGKSEIALRLFPILGSACTFLCICVYLRKRHRMDVVLLSGVALLLSALFTRYAVEARGYSLEAAFLAFAMVCYQRVPALRWSVLFGLSLALAESMHYYAILATGGFALAEIVYLLRARRVRWPVWAGLASGVLPLAICWPLLARMKAEFAAHIWTRYDLTSVPSTYGWLFSASSLPGMTIVLVCAAAVIATHLTPQILRRPEAAANESELTEAALLLWLLALPIIAQLAMKLMAGAMTDRYTLATTLGVVVALAYALSLARKTVVNIFALLLLGAVGLHEYRFWQSLRSLQVDNPSRYVEEFVSRAGYQSLPVAISSGTRALQLQHYASPAFRDRYVYLEDENLSLQYSGTDSVDRNLVILKQYAPYRVEPFTEFVDQHPQFLLFVEYPGLFDWLPKYLPISGYSIREVLAEPHRTLFLVSKVVRGGSKTDESE
jgi:uncharacterized membrane protein